MTTPTPNLGLLLYNGTTDSTATFLAWRLANDGDGGGSNMSLIDTAIGADRARLTAIEALSTIIPVSATYISGSAYTATGITAITSYTNALVIQLKLNLVNPGAITLDINTLGVKPVVKLDTTGAAISLAAGDLAPNRLNLFNYNSAIGSGSWVWINGTSADQVNIVGTAGNLVTVNTDKSLLGTLTQSLMLSQTTHSATTKVTPIDTDEIPLVDTASSNVLKRILISDLKTYLSSKLGAMIVAATAKLPIGTDVIGYADISDSSTKKATFQQLTSQFGVFISSLTAKTSLATADALLLMDSAAANVSKQITMTNFWGAMGAFVAAFTSKGTPLGADSVPLSDSASSGAIKNATLTNIFAQLGIFIAAFTAKSSPVGADIFSISDSAASSASKRVTLAQLTSQFGVFIAALTAKSSPVAADGILIVDSAASNVSKYSTFTNLTSQLGVFIAALTGKTTPIDADGFLISDSAASNVSKLLTFTNLKAFLKTYFDTLYPPLSTTLSSAYTPTLTNTTNIDSSTAFPCQYMRVGNVVTVSGRFSIDPTAAGAVVLKISLPIASNFSQNYQLGGVASCLAVAISSPIISDATNDAASVEFTAVDTALRAWSFSFTYQII